MSGIESALHRLLAWTKPLWEAAVRFFVTLSHRALSLWCDVRDRHERLMDNDPRYPVALASGGAAVVKVVITNPSIVKAVTVLLDDLLGGQGNRVIDRPSWQPPNRWSSGHDVPSSGSPLWDRDDWDDE